MFRPGTLTDSRARTQSLVRVLIPVVSLGLTLLFPGIGLGQDPCSEPRTVLTVYSILEITITVDQRLTFHRRGNYAEAFKVYQDYKQGMKEIPVGTQVSVCTRTVTETWAKTQCGDGTTKDLLLTSKTSPPPPATGCVTMYWK